MPRTLVIDSTLVETDSPELVLARDPAGANYLAILAERTHEGDRFLCVAISTERISRLCAGTVDLREAFVSNENGEAYVGDFFLDAEMPTLALHPLDSVPDAWLPGAGFPLPMFLGSTEGALAELKAQAVANRTSVGSFSLNPPEAAYGHKIDSFNLADGIRLFQNLVIEAGQKAARELGKQAKQLFFTEDQSEFIFQITPQFTPGSFVVHFESKPGLGRGLFGETPMGHALRKLDQLTSRVDDPDSALPVLQQNSGHLIRAYQSMLKFVGDRHAPFSYAWAEPSTPEPVEQRVGVASARRTYEVLTRRSELSAVEVTLEGRFVEMGEKGVGGRWRLDVGKGKRRVVYGELLSGAPDLLDNVRFKRTMYRLTCEERLFTNVVTGRTTRRYYLKSPPVSLG